MKSNTSLLPIWVKNGFLFKVLYLFLGLLSFNSLVCNRPILTLASYALTLLGAIYLVVRLVHIRHYYRTKGILLLLLFLVSYGISALLTLRYGLGENIKAGVWLVFQFFLLYAYDVDASKESVAKEFRIFTHIFLIYTFLMALAGLILFLFNYHSYQDLPGGAAIVGFLWNRLWGLYSDPNYGGIFGVISIVLCARFLWQSKAVWYKVLCLISILLQLIYIALSDSRTALVALVVTGGCGMLLFSLGWKKLRSLSKLAASVCMIVLVVVGCVLPYYAVEGFSAAGSYTLHAIYLDNPTEPSQGDGDLQLDDPDQSLNVGRPLEDMGGDISNRRFSIWQSALEITATSPVFGVSFRNVVPYAQDNLPDTYIVNNDHGNFPSMHNVMVDVMVSQGIVGLVLWIAFILLILVTILTKLWKLKGAQYQECALMLCTLIPIAVSAMFYSEILYINTGASVFFWTVLGYLLHQLTSKETAQP